ncbi:MAG: DUF6438 domain-containing protein [Flavobacteriales bacterium]|jgi:hypothetical protein|tara:strand:+ start:47327 stop:47758 length:432 start_codon:yes stop_codon:yes gene_type:complete
MKYFLIILISYSFACTTQFPTTVSSNLEQIIYLQKTPCFGNCPEYEIVIFRNGEANYIGKRNVEVIGERSLSITEREIKKILSFAKKINFYLMEDEYSEKITDLPTTYIQIKNKKIIDYIGAPKELKKLEDKIENLIFKKIVK